jgi:dolichol-phosphate mannosyltransferase
VRESLDAFWRRLGPERQRFLRFAVVGASGVVVNFAFMALGLWLFAGLEAGTREALASALGIAVSVFSNFLLNDAWTWGDRGKGPRKRDWLLRLSAYSVGAGIGATAQFGTFLALRGAFDLHVYLSQGAGILVGTALNYVINNRLVFKDKQT